jgi:hypothetical protein
MLKGKGILLKARPLGRPSALSIQVSPGERNPIEGKFGQAKTAYGLDRIKARLKETNESWIAGNLYGKQAMPAYLSVEQVSSRGNGRSLTADPIYRRTGSTYAPANAICVH